ncbi:hypothetical protein TIFTF001_007262 [Ficus carica]|uniref:Uncharacterized protein n=1 Tax=Ficus carica TaxID=3494 RepID=A0AA87ZKU8_FICCA|nr:hypothetical protein TIFTF001_007262 [Ficus carica]
MPLMSSLSNPPSQFLRSHCRELERERERARNKKRLRGYSAAASASQGVVSSVARGGATGASRSVKKNSGKEIAGISEKVSWVPDPVTGYYRPESGVQEIDVAELRAALLKKH